MLCQVPAPPRVGGPCGGEAQPPKMGPSGRWQHRAGGALVATSSLSLSYPISRGHMLDFSRLRTSCLSEIVEKLRGARGLEHIVEDLHGAHDVLVLGGRDQRPHVPLLTPRPPSSPSLVTLLPSPSCSPHPVPSSAPSCPYPVPCIPHFSCLPWIPLPAPTPVPIPSLPG